MACNALETDAPNRLNPTMIARNVLMLDILVNVVGKFEKLSLVFLTNAFKAKIVVRLMLRFKPFFSRS